MATIRFLIRVVHCQFDIGEVIFVSDEPIQSHIMVAELDRIRMPNRPWKME